MQIRPETSLDWPAVYQIHAAAFPTLAEADLVERLRKTATPLISLVALEQDALVGHILFTPVTLANCQYLLIGLAPVAVTPARQNQGIGAALINAGQQQCRLAGAAAVFVLGQEEYYPRFGFVPAAPRGITCEYDVPVENFMMLTFETCDVSTLQGTVRYDAEFAKL